MDRNQLEREIQAYNPDEDIRNSGGSYGMFLADLMHSYGLTESNFKDLERVKENQSYVGRTSDVEFQSKISQKEFRNLADEMGIMEASRIGAIDSKISLLEYAGIFNVIASDGKVIKIDEANSREIDDNFRDYYNQR